MDVAMNNNSFRRRIACFLIAASGMSCLLAAEPQPPSAPGDVPPATTTFSISASSPAHRAAWQQHLTLGPGDVLNLSLLDMPDTARIEVPVGPDGRIGYLQAANVMATGLTIDELRGKLDETLGKFYQNPHTIIIPVAYRSKKYVVMGAVANRGVFAFDRPTSVIEAIARAGGLQTGLYETRTVELADLQHSFLARNGQRLPVNFEALFQHGDLSQNVPLEPNDYLYFASASGNDIYVLGEVMLPGPMIYNSNPTVLNAIATRGGYTTHAFKSRVLVVRGSLSHPQTFVVDTADILHGRQGKAISRSEPARHRLREHEPVGHRRRGVGCRRKILCPSLPGGDHHAARSLQIAALMKKVSFFAFAALIAALLAGCSSPNGKFESPMSQPRPAWPATNLPGSMMMTNPLSPEMLKPEENFFTLGPGDSVEVEMLGNPTSRAVALVGPDGKIYYNLLPGLDVWGLTLAQTTDSLEKELGKYFSSPHVSVTLRAVGSKYVWLLGRLNKPGIFPLTGPTTILELIAMAGGPQNSASTGSSENLADFRHSFIVRQGQFLPVNFHRLLHDGDTSQNIYLQTDDFIYVPSLLSQEIYVLGAVRYPRALPYTERMTLMSWPSPAETAWIATTGFRRAALTRDHLPRTPISRTWPSCAAP